MLACREGHKDVVKYLLEYSDSNIELNARDNDGRTAFKLACRAANKDVVKLLMEYAKIDIDIPEDLQGWFRFVDNFGCLDITQNL